MRVIVDANIVFSGILNSIGNIGNLLINSRRIFNFIAPEFLQQEIRYNYQKLMNISKLPFEDLLEEKYRICKSILFISEEQIFMENWEFAYNLANDIDPKDIVYLAFAKQYECNLWTGDKQLKKGLSAKGFENVVSTNEMLDIRQQILSEKLLKNEND